MRGNFVCFGCSGLGFVVEASEAGVEKARAVVASGALDAYLAGLAAKRAAKAAESAAADAADVAQRVAMDSALARRDAAKSAFIAVTDDAREAGLDDAADNAVDMGTSIRRAGYACFSADAVNANAQMMETLVAALRSYILDNDAEVIAARAFAAMCREADSYTVEVTIYG
jgi:hypothetical protein